MLEFKSILNLSSYIFLFFFFFFCLLLHEQLADSYFLPQRIHKDINKTELIHKAVANKNRKGRRNCWQPLVNAVRHLLSKVNARKDEKFLRLPDYTAAGRILLSNNKNEVY